MKHSSTNVCSIQRCIYSAALNMFHAPTKVPFSRNLGAYIWGRIWNQKFGPLHKHNFFRVLCHWWFCIATEVSGYWVIIIIIITTSINFFILLLIIIWWEEEKKRDVRGASAAWCNFCPRSLPWCWSLCSLWSMILLNSGIIGWPLLHILSFPFSAS